MPAPASAQVIAVEAGPEVGGVPIEEVVPPELVRAHFPDVSPGIGDPGDRDPEIPERAERALVAPNGKGAADPPFVVVAGAADRHVSELHVVPVRRAANNEAQRGGLG